MIIKQGKHRRLRKKMGQHVFFHILNFDLGLFHRVFDLLHSHPLLLFRFENVYSFLLFRNKTQLMHSKSNPESARKAVRITIHTESNEPIYEKSIL